MKKKGAGHLPGARKGGVQVKRKNEGIQPLRALPAKHAASGQSLYVEVVRIRPGEVIVPARSVHPLRPPDSASFLARQFVVLRESSEMHSDPGTA